MSRRGCCGSGEEHGARSAHRVSVPSHIQAVQAALTATLSVGLWGYTVGPHGGKGRKKTLQSCMAQLESHSVRGGDTLGPGPGSAGVWATPKPQPDGGSCTKGLFPPCHAAPLKAGSSKEQGVLVPPRPSDCWNGSPRAPRGALGPPAQAWGGGTPSPAAGLAAAAGMHAPSPP